MIIGDIGINHNGNLNIALSLIKEAKRLGIDVVKFQKRNPDLCVPEAQKKLPKNFLGEEMTYLEYKKKIEFGKEEYDIINKFCKDLGILWTASVWDTDSVDFMAQYLDDIPFIKIPSACITNVDIINRLNNLKAQVVCSNGMSTQKEVDFAVEKIEKLFAILHCNSSYPSKENELDLNVINAYKIRYPHLFIGYSGHEEGFFPTLVAASMGASIIERHITLDKNMEGSDQKASLDMRDLELMMTSIKRIRTIQGEYSLRCYPEEEIMKKKLRK